MQYKMFDFMDVLGDPRRGQGQRHKLTDVISMVIMAILSGSQGLKGFARFAKSNEAELVSLLHSNTVFPVFLLFERF